jgi:hypothetical protein
MLEDTCEDQRSAMQEWIDALDEWPCRDRPAWRRERELLRVRSRDVLEHIERVLTHVRRLEQSAENAVQMHFSALGHRTNDIMRTLTVLTAIFLPLNLITGFFGMNFDALPLIHASHRLLGHAGVVGLDDARHQRVAHHVGAGEVREGHARHALEHAFGVDQAAGRALGQVDLADVAGHHARCQSRCG